MTKEFSKEDIIETCKSVMHPAINCNLVELGIANIEDVNKEKIIIYIKIPFPNVPKHMIDTFAAGLFDAIKKITQEAEVEFKVIFMNEEERNRFLIKEKENWKGGESACG